MSHKDESFLHRGYTHWKDATGRFSKHEASDCDKEAVQSIVVHPQTTRDIGEQLYEVHALEEERQQAVAIEDLTKSEIPCLSKPCYPRRDKDECDSNFVQFKLRGKDDLRVKSWMDKKTGKYTSPDIQNEML